ncbi:M16 family metallopeptidase [Nitratireductor sp. GCM10026969]|uniref:M16 family metallopeptidase n=1 Tax=Nitratireductor sp. GCM10026969 TaxID=3252645 RepID=UPI003623AE42
MRLLSVFALIALLMAPAFNQAAAQAPQPVEVETFVLDNGLKVVVVPDRRVPVVTHMLWYKVGSADEERGQSGIAHFFEHLMFKRTETHEEGAFDAAVKAVGGNQNAFTTQDYTAYFQQVPPDALGEMMAFEADRMENLILDEQAIETERRVVMEERLQRVDNRPFGILNEAVDATLYKNHPYGIPVIGWMHEIEALDRDELVAFYERYYTPNNAVLVVAGDVDAETVRRLVSETYGRIPPGPDLPPRVRPTEPEPRTVRSVTLHDPRASLPSFIRQWFAPAYFSEQGKTADALQVLTEILGGGSRSRLYQELVVKSQIASAVSAWTGVGRLDYSSVGIYAQSNDTAELDEVERVIDAEIAKIAAEGVSEKELETAKNVLASRLILDNNDQMSRAMEYGVTLVTGGTVDDLGKTRERIEAVTVEDVRAAARTYLGNRRGVTGYLLPEEADTASEQEDPA